MSFFTQIGQATPFFTEDRFADTQGKERGGESYKRDLRDTYFIRNRTWAAFKWGRRREGGRKAVLTPFS